MKLFTILINAILAHSVISAKINHEIARNSALEFANKIANEIASEIASEIATEINVQPLRRQKRDQISWNRTRNTLSKVSRNHTQPSYQKSRQPSSYRDQLEQHYQNNPHRSNKRRRDPVRHHNDDAEQQFLMDFFY